MYFEMSVYVCISSMELLVSYSVQLIISAIDV